jgi:hypothetical protein
MGRDHLTRVSSPAPPVGESWVKDLRTLYYRHFGDHKKERQLYSTGAFLVTFASVRAITHAIRAQRGPFKNVTAGGRRIHHMTFGITGLLAVGYLWLLEIGTNDQRRRASRLTSIGFGSGAALTLDEFALWPNLEDRCGDPVRRPTGTQPPRKGLRERRRQASGRPTDEPQLTFCRGNRRSVAARPLASLTGGPIVSASAVCSRGPNLALDAAIA